MDEGKMPHSYYIKKKNVEFLDVISRRDNRSASSWLDSHLDALRQKEVSNDTAPHA